MDDEPSEDRRLNVERRTAQRKEMKDDMASVLVSHDEISMSASKQIVKDAIREWLDDKYTQFGVWTLRAILASSVALLGYLLLVKLGWKPPH